MVAYVIVIREEPVHTPEQMAEYARKGANIPRDPKMKALAINGALTALEGDPPNGVVMLEFPTVEDAKAWYYSDAYQDACQHRRAAAKYRTVIVEGV
ncbi:MAG TPA: DUF1330 domain-containing protein [Phenylobacterium sp.]|uniref:DUF1330 domain-containing protein n=1 Tax=Phenylobacterium sp. TaxID=1871053 RepID=UPI002B49BF14|nr:DUF1330 domain-containing protein [Phenylobacterium sp.]HKR89339.1 DUF1330 domain-containing protein [Phenylobacterium sp.]